MIDHTNIQLPKSEINDCTELLSRIKKEIESRDRDLNGEQYKNNKLPSCFYLKLEYKMSSSDGEKQPRVAFAYIRRRLWCLSSLGGLLEVVDRR